MVNIAEIMDDELAETSEDVHYNKDCAQKMARFLLESIDPARAGQLSL